MEGRWKIYVDLHSFCLRVLFKDPRYCSLGLFIPPRERRRIHESSDVLLVSDDPRTIYFNW